MKNQALFPQRDISKKIKCRLLQFLLGALRVNYVKSENQESTYQNVGFYYHMQIGDINTVTLSPKPKG